MAARCICRLLGRLSVVVWLWAGAKVARAQVSVLEPFEFTASVRVGTANGWRELSGGTVILASESGIEAQPAFTLDSGDATRGNVLGLVQRDIDGRLLSYRAGTLGGPSQTVVFLQNGSRWVSPPMSIVDAPRTGNLHVDWMWSDLCAVTAIMPLSSNEQVSSVAMHALAGEWSAGFQGFRADEPPLATARGFLVVREDGKQTVQGELLLPRGGPGEVSALVSLLGGEPIEFVGATGGTAGTCPESIVLEELVPTDPEPSGDDETGDVKLLLRMREEPRSSLESQPEVRVEKVEIIAPWADGPGRALELVETTSDGVSVFEGDTVLAGAWSIKAETSVAYGSANHAILTLSNDVEGGGYGPLVPLPVTVAPTFGFYPDATFVLQGDEKEELRVDGRFLTHETAVELQGCFLPGDLAKGRVVWTQEALEGALFVDENDRISRARTGGAQTTVSFGPERGNYLLPLWPGRWREREYGLLLQRFSTEGGPHLDAELSWRMRDEATVGFEAQAMGPFAIPVRETPLSAVVVTVRVGGTTGRKLLRSPQVTASSSGGLSWVEDWTLVAKGSDDWREVHHVLVPAFAGTLNLAIRAFVDMGPGVMPAETTFPSISAVPFRPARPDGTCAAICTDPGINRFWDDDLSPPRIELTVPRYVANGPLELTGVVRDESPVVGLTLDGEPVPLDGDDTSTERRFRALLHVTDTTTEAKFAARDRCGGVRTLVHPLERQPNRPPVIERVGGRPVTEPLAFVAMADAPLRLLVEAYDPDGDPVTFGVEADDGLPSGLFMSSRGMLAWTPTFDDRGDRPLTLIASDGRGGVTRESILVRVNAPNRAPVVQAPEVAVVREGESLVVRAEAVDPDGDAVVWTLDPMTALLPPVKFETNGTVATLTWTPGYDDAGERRFTFVATDPFGAQGEATIVVTVVDVNRPPVIEPVPAQLADGKRPGRFTINAWDPDGDELECRVERLPEGTTWDARERTVAWEELVYPEGVNVLTVVCSDGMDETRLDIELESRLFALVGGCGCQGQGPAAWSLWALLGLVAWRRPRFRR